MRLQIFKPLILFIFILSLSFCSEEAPNSPVATNSKDTLIDSTLIDTSKQDTTISDTTISDTTKIVSPIVYDKNIIDDFEDGDGAAAQGGGWYVFTEGGASTYEIAKNGKDIIANGEGYNNSKYSITLSYTLNKGDYEWDPYVNLGVSLGNNPPFDASEYAGVQYFYKGPNHIFMAEMKSLNDAQNWDTHTFPLKGSDEWKEYNINFADLQQEGWGDPVDFDPSDLKSLDWRIQGKTGDNGELYLDDIKFLDTIIVEKKYDMEIKDPLIPDLDSIGDTSLITTKLHTKAMKYLNKGVNLTNWLEDHKFDGTFDYDEKRIAKFATQGFKSIRFPIDIDLYVLNRDEVLAGTTDLAVDSTIFEPLDSMINWTAKYGLSLTIDYHQYDGSLNPTTISDANYMSMVSNTWKAVAQRYVKNNREDIFYELTNEPGISAPVSSADWHILAQQMLDSIRSVDKIHTTIFGDTRWYDINILIKAKLLNDNNTIYAFHMYDPFIFTHQGASWVGMATTKNIPFPYSKEAWSTEFSYFGITDAMENWQKDAFKNYYKTGNKNTIENSIIKVKNWAIENNVALVCNEFGANSKKAEPKYLANYFKTMGEIFSELGIAWQVWFGTFDDNGDLQEGVGKALNLE